MKIVKVEAFALQAPYRAVAYWGTDLWARSGDPTVYPPPHRMRPVYSPKAETVLVKLTTDAGVSGYGEAKAPVVPDVTARLIHDLLAPQLLGQDPLQIHVLWEKLFNSMRLRGHSRGFLLEAISGVDIALWDLAGHALDQPVYKLLGGAHQKRVPVYASGVPPVPLSAATDQWELLRKVTRQYVGAGYRMIKVGAGIGLESDVATVQAVLEAAGPGIQLCVDAVGQYDRGTAAALADRLWALGVAWLEGPLVPEDLSGYAELARRVEMPISYYVMFTHRDAVALLAQGGVDILQPDVCRCGGITEAVRIAELADVFSLGFALHGSVGSVVSLAAARHLAAAVPNLRGVEFWTDQTPLITELATTQVLPEEGVLAVTDAPGLGIAIDDAKLEEYSVSHYSRDAT